MRYQKFFLLVVVIFSLGSFFIVAPIVQAATKAPVVFTPTVSIPGSQFTATVGVPLETSTAPIVNYIKAYYGYGIGIVGILAAIMLMLGGIVWMTAQGNATEIQKAQGYVTSSLIGLVLVFGAYLILGTVNPDLVNLKVTTIQTIAPDETITCCGGSKGILVIHVTSNDQGQTIDVTTKKPVDCDSLSMTKLDDTTQLCIDTGSGYNIIPKGQVCGSSGGFCFAEDPKPIGWTDDLNENCPDGQYCYYHDSNAKMENESCGTLGGVCLRNPDGISNCPDGYSWEKSGGADCGNSLYCCDKDITTVGAKCGMDNAGTCMTMDGLSCPGKFQSLLGGLSCGTGLKCCYDINKQ